MKAAFLFSFAKFVSWPDRPLGDTKTKFLVCVLGPEFVSRSVREVVAGKTIQGTPVEVQHARSKADLDGCFVIFISASEHDDLDQRLAMLENQPALLVSDTEGFVRRGGMIELFVENRRVAFHVNHAAIRHAGLRISSRVLALARNVIGEPAEGHR